MGTQTFVRYVVVALTLASFASQVQAFCTPGDVQTCIVNQQPGQQVCGSNSMYGPCIPTVAPAPPVPAAPSVGARSAQHLVVHWSDAEFWSSASYRLLYREGTGGWQTLTTLTQSSITYTHSGLLPDTRYCYSVQVSADTGTRTSEALCRYTVDATGRRPARVQIELRTGDVEDAGTDDSVQVTLGELPNAGMYATWLDYGRDDFERADVFAYDLDFAGLAFVSDITRIKITKGGTDGWCLRGLRMLVNEVPVYDEELAGSCRWLDPSNGVATYEVDHARLRAHPLWQQYVEPLCFSIEANPPHYTATLRIPRAETEQRIEGLIGDLTHGTEAKWGELHGRAVEASRGGQPGKLAIDLDLSADVPAWFNPELDVDFDLNFQSSCSPDGSGINIDITSEALRAAVDFNWFTEFLDLILGVCAPQSCVSALESYIAGRVEAGVKPFTTSVDQRVPAPFRCLSSETIVHDSADVDLVFHLEAAP